MVSASRKRAARRLDKQDTTGSTYFATCAQGLGEVLADELRGQHINAQVIQVASSGVLFRGARDSEHMHTTAYKACLWLRTATRVLHLLCTSSIPMTDRLSTLDAVYDLVKRSVNWSEYLREGRNTFSVQIRVPPNDSRMPSFRALQTRSKDAICDALRDARCEKPHPPPNHAEADVPLLLVLHDTTLTLYRDMVGASLHKRGYRRDSPLHRSSLNESVAAGMLYFAGFTPDGTLPNPGDTSGDLFIVDPMCGSATILIEAALLRLQVAVGLYRPYPFPFEGWIDFSDDEYSRIRELAFSAQVKDSEARIRLLGSDIHRGAIQLAAHDIATTRLDSLIELRHADIRDVRLDQTPTLVISNPPWGRRLDEGDAWHDLGVFLREQAADSYAVLISGDASATRSLRMKARNRYPLRTGDTPVRVLIYDVLPKLQKKEEVTRHLH